MSEQHDCRNAAGIEPSSHEVECSGRVGAGARSSAAQRGRGPARSRNALPLCSFIAAAGMFWATSASAAHAGIVVESEANFVARYKSQIEQIAPGVYLFNAGAYAGKVVTIGEAGLDYDIAALRNQMKSRTAQGKAPGKTPEVLADLERAKTAMRAARAAAPHKAADATALFCRDYDWRHNRTIYYNGSAEVSATITFWNNNSYYAEAYSGASATVRPPYYHFPRFATSESCAYAENKLTGVTAGGCVPATISGSISVGPVKSGVSFEHHLTARAYVSGTGECFGYVSVADQMLP